MTNASTPNNKPYKLLLTPGPTKIPNEILVELSKPIVHHRTRDFEVVFEQVRQQLKWLFQTKSEVLSIASTGTGVMEATVVNLFSAGDSVITVNAGKFGERWTKIAKAYGCNVHEIYINRGEAVTLSHIQEAWDKCVAASGDGAGSGAGRIPKAILFQASETSTGVENPTKEIVQFCKSKNILSVCDAITACGVFNLPMDEWGIDVLMTASQKAFMLPPGLAFISFSDQAWSIAAESKLPKFYFDLKRELKMQQKNQTAWTPSISLIYAAKVSLDQMQREGLQPMFDRHAMLAKYTREKLAALGFPLFTASPSDAVTTVMFPKVWKGVTLADDFDGKKVIDLMRDHHDVIIAGGQDELTGKILRFSHFGCCTKEDLDQGFQALSQVMDSLVKS